MPNVNRKAEEGKAHTQSVVFEKESNWTESTSKDWVKKHDFYDDGLDETETQYRWRQYDPDESKFDYRTLVIVENSISYIRGIPKKKSSSDKKDEKDTMKLNNLNQTPIRCFEGNAKPHERFWSLNNQVEEADPEILFYGIISEYSWYDDDITPKMFRDDLNKIGKGGPVTIRLNSPGGDMIAASVIRSILMEYPGKITIKIDGMAASAATILAIAGDEIQMVDTAFFVIHDPFYSFFLANINIDMMESLLDSLWSAKSALLDAYEKHTGLERDRISEFMKKETWFTAQEAIDYGFVDKLLETNKMAKKESAKLIENILTPSISKMFTNMPVNLVNRNSSKPDSEVDKLRKDCELIILKK